MIVDGISAIMSLPVWLHKIEIRLTQGKNLSRLNVTYAAT